MNAALQQLIDSLRNELQQYGEMLALLEAQQDVLSGPGPSSVLNSIAVAEGQAAAVFTARQSRENCQRQLAWALGRPEGEVFTEILPLLPTDCRPLVSALVEEINQSLKLVRTRAGLSHDQLRRSVVLMERFLVSLSSEAWSASLGETDPSPADPPPRFAATP
ncbi:MAG TPA: hypothetical protein VNM37_26425 [Candidatus Dormibacteraeota bacterium]|nr:hypothetical protein [Verrucomicrobiae bacterium]HXJ76421.1 hypothetical protein [Candidatus Dormibacteraeota bacterium]